MTEKRNVEGVTRIRRLTAEEVAKDVEIRERVEEEFSPALPVPKGQNSTTQGNGTIKNRTRPRRP
jgi:hypothetical protein